MSHCDMRWQAMPTFGSDMWMIAVKNTARDAYGQPFVPVADHVLQSDARRIAAALNVLSGIPTERLERVAERRTVGGGERDRVSRRAN